MKYERFEDLPVWQDAIGLAERVYAATKDDAFRYMGDLRSQLQRAALSISNNIAEGFERGTTQELVSFLYIARGSAGECRSMFCLLERLPAFSHLKSQISDLKSLTESVARQLRAWAQHLQDTEIKGQRYLTADARRELERQKEYEAFKEKLKRIQEEAARKWSHPQEGG